MPEPADKEISNAFEKLNIMDNHTRKNVLKVLNSLFLSHKY